MNPDDTIVAVSSPPGAAARGIVRLSGPEAVPIADALFAADSDGSLSAITESRYCRGTIRLDGATLPAAVYLFRAPRSYTRQDIVEIHLLGSPGILALVIEECLAEGARRAEAGEFTARAYLAGAFDLTQVHAVAGMIAARSDHQLRAAERLMHGALGRTASEAREELAEIVSLVEAALDFADEPIEFITAQELHRRLKRVKSALQSTAAAGLKAERWGQLPKVLLAGPPNVGKSSLLNRLSGLDRAICAPAAGTTRDVLSAPMTVDDLECLLLDVAGIEAHGGGLEAKIQAAARRAIEGADLLVCVVDITAPGDQKDIRVPLGPHVPVVIAANKCDLVSRQDLPGVQAALAEALGQPVCPTSAVTGQGCDDLKASIRVALHGREVDVHDAAIALMAEHRWALDQAADALDRAIDLAAESTEGLENAELVAAELRTAAGALGTLVGEEQTEEMLGRIFARFCIGK